MAKDKTPSPFLEPLAIVITLLPLRFVGTANTLFNTVGEAPDALLQMLNKGPGAHIRANAYRYNEAIPQGGKVRINRIRLIQERFLEFWARLTHAAMIGISTVLSQESIAGAARRRA